MNFIKKFAVFMGVILCSGALVYSAQQNPAITRDASGAYVYETTIGSLVQRGMLEDIKVINNSSYPLAYLTCKIVIKGKEHAMKPIAYLKVADSEGFDGYYEDDMNREIPKYFGKDGKFSKSNNNAVKFVLQMKENADKVAITDVYDSKDDLCFIISDLQEQAPQNVPAAVVPVAPAAPAVVPAEPAAPSVAPAEPAAQEVAPATETQKSNDDATVVIDGKKYLLHNGKAYPVQ
jgi:hypothetical protein